METRKLSTILFVDIAGYTDMMQGDEAKALGFLKTFKITLEQVVGDHQGQIIQYFGDGCLLSFDSTSQGVRCGLNLQKAFQKENLPARIGMHLGEVVFSDDNAFGDGVNIASRIESMGVPGAVLLSKTVRNQIKNKADFELVPLGAFHFKNVEEPIEVFAIANEGIVVPRREELQGKFKPPESRPKVRQLVLVSVVLLVVISGIWFWRVKKSPLTDEQRNSYIAILPFENATNEASLDGFGTMVSDWLTTELLETGEVKIVGASNLKKEVAQAGISISDITETFAEKGIGMLLSGRYYIQDDQLYVRANIVDTRTGLVVHAPNPIIRSQTEKGEILVELSDEILGFWEVRNLNRFRQDPPRYEAYREYQAGMEDFAQGYHTREARHYLLSETHFLKSYELDTTFLTPLLQLCVTYFNLQRYTEQDSLYAALEDRTNDMTKWERKTWQFEQSRLLGKNLEAARIAEEMFVMDPSDELAFSRAMRAYRRANYPKRALELRQKADSMFIGQLKDYYNFSDWRDDPLYMLREFDSIYAMYNKDIQVLDRPWKNRMYVQVLIQTGHYEEIPERILMAPKSGPFGKAVLLYRICNTLLLKNEKELARVYAQQLKEFALNHKEEFEFEQWMGEAEMFMENYPKAARHFESYLVKDANFSVPKDLIACYANLGSTGKIENLIADIPEFPGREQYISYSRAIAQTILGDYDQAINLLSTSISLGAPFNDLNYGFEYHFRPLFNDPRFQRLVHPRG